MAIAVAAGVVASRPTRSGPSTTTTVAPTTAVDAVEVDSDAPTYGSLTELVDASDLVVVGEVTAVERGRWFGDGEDGARLQSRLVTLQVDEVVRGAPRGEVGQLLVEEEGWLADGRPLVIDGAAPSQVGDRGVWFLVDTGDESTDAWIVVNAQGRYLDEGGRLVGAQGDDALIGELEALSQRELVEAVGSA